MAGTIDAGDAYEKLRWETPLSAAAASTARELGMVGVAERAEAVLVQARSLS
jgi:hypothetical protein